MFALWEIHLLGNRRLSCVGSWVDFLKEKCSPIKAPKVSVYEKGGPLCSMCKKWKNSLFMPILQEVCIILQQISIIFLFWVFWLHYRTLKKFVDTTMGLMKSAEISLIFLKVCWSQYGTQFFVTSIGQVCWREYVAPSTRHVSSRSMGVICKCSFRKPWLRNTYMD